jgi:hypothetical protein
MINFFQVSILFFSFCKYKVEEKQISIQCFCPSKTTTWDKYPRYNNTTTAGKVLVNNAGGKFT